MRLTFLLAVSALAYTNPVAIEKLAFLSGCWAGSGIEEMWTKPAGGTMMGLSRTVKGDKTAFTEFFHVSTNIEGSIVLNVQLRLAGKSSEFRLTELKDQTVTFSNPEHDYPQRIIYRRETNGSLFARIEGTTAGKARHDEFKYSRVRCGE